ncbi:MAG: hypothetical protein K9G59_09415 [Caulobacter sp.]|nr:hypothetical protein [Caulobacter sp.]
MRTLIGLTACASLLMTASAVWAATTPTALTYQGNPVNGYLGGNADFPSQFVGAPLCEGGKSGPDQSSGCVVLRADGTGTWENDVAFGRRLPPAPIKWYVVADKAGTVTRVSADGRDTYFVIFEFTQAYYSMAPGDMIAFPANLIKGSPGRVVIDSKYRNVN